MITLKPNDLKTISPPVFFQRQPSQVTPWPVTLACVKPFTKWPFLLLSVFWKPCTRSFQSCCKMQDSGKYVCFASAGGSFLRKHEVISRQTESRVVWTPTITLTVKCFVFSHLLFLSVWCFSLPFPPYCCDSLLWWHSMSWLPVRVRWLYVCLRKEMILFKLYKGSGGCEAHMRFQNNTCMRALKHTTEK